MKQNKKGIEMGLNVIVVAIIVLLILVILAYFITDGFQNFNSGKACVEKGGQCQQYCDGTTQIIGDKLCPVETDVCCKIVG